MLAPLSWLKEYVDITLSPKELGDRLTEVGLGTEKITKADGDVIFEFEITPNRPDLLSILGIAREIAAVERKKIRQLNLPNLTKPKKESLPIKLNPDYKLFQRWTGISIANISIKPSPQWMQDRLTKIGLRPINNVIDITNYVMFELGIPLHAFDYDQIIGHEMTVEKAIGGEHFTSVDEKSYHLPKNAIIIKDKERIIDLAGIKGGLNSGITDNTKNVFLHVTIDDPILIRKASIALSLRSDASAIYERGVDKGGTLKTLARAAQLVIELAGGNIASKIYDLKNKAFEPWKLKLRTERMNNILGIEIPEKRVLSILESLNLNPSIITLSSFPRKRESRFVPVKTGIKSGVTDSVIECTVPTYRNDLKIEEDLIEEVARIYGYNNFPKTIPIGQLSTKKIPYFKDFKIEEIAKNILQASGLSEIYTYSLIGEKDLTEQRWKTEDFLRVDNPVSLEFEYLRPTLKINLLKGFSQNKPNFKDINLFELGKVYLGNNLNEAKESYFLSGISNTKNFFEVKGILERLFDELGIKEDPTKFIEILDEGVFFEINYSEIIKQVDLNKKYIPLPKYPPIIEDLALIIEEKIKTGDIINEIKQQSRFVTDVSLLDTFRDSRTFHIIYQNKEGNLTTEEVGKIREKIIKFLKEKFNAKVKE